MENIDKRFSISETLGFYRHTLMSGGLYEVLPEIEEETEGYAGIIKKASAENGPVPVGTSELFQIPITTGIGQDYYNLVWNVLEPEFYDIKPELVSIDEKNIFSDPKRLEPPKLAKYLNAKLINPTIILACHSAINTWIVIDGNHRLHASRINGMKSINAVCLTPAQHVDYMLSEQMKALYKVHHNLFLLMNLCLSPLLSRGYSSDHSLSPKSYYPLMNPIKFKYFSSLKLWAKQFRSRYTR